MSFDTSRAFALSAALSLAACATQPSTPDTPTPDTPTTEDARGVADSTPPVLPAEAGDPALVATAQQGFAAGLLEQASTASPGENVFLSPYSIHVALGMTMAGARGETAAEMAAALGLGELPEGRRHSAMRAHADSLVIEPVSKDRGDAFAFSSANRVWVAQGLELLAPFVETTRELYGAEAAPVDFGASEAARATINAWISKATFDKIPELIPAGILDSDTRLVLTNALYFKGSWAHAFHEASTQDATFAAPGGDVVVPMMRAGAAGYAYGSGADYEVLSMPYMGGADMLVILPRPGKLDEVSKSLRGGGLGDVMTGAMERRQVAVGFPRFTSRVPFTVNDALEALGIEQAFSPGAADFSGMYAGARAERLHISHVLHEAFIAVDEAGTEAAAATAVVMKTRSAPSGRPLQFTVNRPFFFVIRHTETNTPLFVGRVLDPTSK